MALYLYAKSLFFFCDNTMLFNKTTHTRLLYIREYKLYKESRVERERSIINRERTFVQLHALDIMYNLREGGGGKSGVKGGGGVWGLESYGVQVTGAIYLVASS